MGTHGCPQALIQELLKGLLDRGVDVLDGPCDHVFCPCGHGLRVLDGPFGLVFFPCGHGLRVLDGPFGLVFFPFGHGLRVLDGPFGLVFCPCGHGLGVLGDVLVGYSLFLTEQGVSLDKLYSELHKSHIPLLVPHLRPWRTYRSHTEPDPHIKPCMILHSGAPCLYSLSP